MEGKQGSKENSTSSIMEAIPSGVVGDSITVQLPFKVCQVGKRVRTCLVIEKSSAKAQKGQGAWEPVQSPARKNSKSSGGRDCEGQAKDMGKSQVIKS